MNGYFRRHPNALVLASMAGIAVTLFSLMEAIEVFHLARRLAGEIQAEVSEGLGG